MSPTRIRFAEFEFDAVSGELRGPGGTVRLQPQPAKVLGALLARPGALVTRDELKRLLWPDTVVEADQGLNFCVRQIRAALGDEADGSRFIETLPRRGYRFVAPVSAGDGSRPSRRRAVARVLALVLVGAVAVLWLRGDSSPGPAGPIRVAVLPLTTPGGESWMAERNRDLTERLVAQLTAIDSLGVIGPATTASLANDPRPHPRIGDSLGVGYVVSGGVRPTDSTMFVQVVRTSDGVHVFAWRSRIAGDLATAAIAIADGIRDAIFQR